MHEQQNFVRMRPRGGARARYQSEAGERSLDDAFAEYARQNGLFASDSASDSARESASESASEGAGAEAEVPPDGDRWSTWDQSTAGERGPRPHPDWVITELAAVDTELGILKSGKEADVFLLERAVPGTERTVLMAAKRYRDSKHRMFHRDAGYLEGRRDKESRVNRAIAKRTAFGREAIAGQWAGAEFAALCRLWKAGAAVPYPVQLLGTELLMEFVGEPDGTAAPRLAQLRPSLRELESLWEQLSGSLSLLAGDGFAHGDLSAYNLLVRDGRLVMIDVPQVVDVIGNPRGRSFLERDVRNVGEWFISRGLDSRRVDQLAADLPADAGLPNAGSRAAEGWT